MNAEDTSVEEPAEQGIVHTPTLTITEHWHTVDRWWTDDPHHTHFVELTAPDGNTMVVGYNVHKQTWKLQRA
jgi:hypothetical protein